MASQFAINPDRFDRTLPELHLSADTSKERLRRSTWQQNIKYIKAVDRDIEKFNSVVRPVQKRLETIEKVIYVAVAAFLLLMPLGFSYFPAWLPWGVGFPTFLILGVLGVKVKQKIEMKKHYYEALLLMREMLKRHSFKALHPLGEWDLPAVDRRLNSDLLMQNELKKKHPESAGHIERLVKTMDLDVTPGMKIQAAHKLAQIPDKISGWGQIKEKVIEAKECLRSRDFKKYEEKIAEAKQAGLKIGGSPPILSTILPSSAKTQVQGIVSHFQYFNQLYGELYYLHEEGKVLFGADFCEEWTVHMENARLAHDKIEKLMPLFETADTHAEQWLSAAESVKEERLTIAIDLLIERTRQLKWKIQTQIANHPVMRIEAYKAQFERFDRKILQAQTLVDLGGWINGNPDQAERPIGEVMNRLPCTAEIKEWMEAHEEWIVDPLIEIYDRNYLMRYEYQQARQRASEFSPLFDQELSVLPLILGKTKRRAELAKRAEKQERGLTRGEWEERQQLSSDIARLQKRFTEEITHGALSGALQNAPSSEEVAVFYKEVMLPLEEVIGNSGEPSFGKRLWKVLVRKLPAHPFEPIEVPREPGFEKSRKIEELVINDFLKKIDQRMVLANRIRRYGLEWVAITVLLIFEAIFSTNPWAAWGIAASTLAIQGLSIYIDYRLRKIDKEKQGLKLQMFLRDHPLITQIPGLRPVLQDLRRVQQAYGLDGATRTWARVLAEGNDVLQIPRSRGEAKGICREIASSGSEEARPALERRLLYLLSRRSEGENRYNRKINDLQNVLYPPLPVREEKVVKQINTVSKAWNRAVKNRIHIQERLELIAQKKKLLSEEVHKHKLAIKFADTLSPANKEQWTRKFGILESMKMVVEGACKGDELRDADEELDPVLEELQHRLSQILDHDLIQEVQGVVLEFTSRLKRFPLDKLLPVAKTLQDDDMEMRVESQRYEKYERRLEVFQELFGSFDRVGYLERIEQLKLSIDHLKKLIEEGNEALVEAEFEEKRKGVLVTLEKHLIRHDPEIEEKRKALLEAIKAQGDQAIKDELQQNLDGLNHSLAEGKEELAGALLQAAVEHRMELIAPALQRWQQKVGGIYRALRQAAQREPQELWQAALKNQARLAGALLAQEVAIEGVIGELLEQLT